MKVVEIFKSIEGEGIRSGQPTVFLRLHGCNLRCTYCDTKYSYEEDTSDDLSIYEIYYKILEFNCKNLTITGGEPLLHSNKLIPLINDLIRIHDVVVNIETNGAASNELITEYRSNLPNDLRQHLFLTTDYKCYSSGMNDKMSILNFIRLTSDDVIKFVVGNIDDLNQVKELAPGFSQEITKNIFVSPIFGNIELVDIAQFLIDNHLDCCRLQVQLHKIVWPPEMRGV